MNDSILQRWIDEIQATSLQQWLIRALIVAAPLVAMAAVAAEVGRWWPFGLIVVPALAVASAFRPDEHTALVVILVLATHWVLTVDRINTPWLPVAAVCLLVYHAASALAATVPIGGALPTSTLWHWLRLTAVVGGGTVAMWALVVVLDRREAPGNGALTALAFIVVTGAALLIRARSLDEPL